jgi:truncated hemoglobin YjbI
MMRGMACTSAGPMLAAPGLFAALGDRPGIGVIVDGLYDRLERDRELARHFRNRRPGQRERLKLFFETIFGGEVRGIRDVGVQRSHLHRLITAGESARWLSHLGAAMHAAGVGQSAQAAVMDLLRGPAVRLVNDGAPKDVLKQALVLAGRGDVAAVASLAGEHPRLIDQRGGDGVTMLWTAARRGRLALVRWLVAQGADIEIPGSAVHVTQVLVSPYCIAVRSRRAEVAQYLLDHGAQVDVFCTAFLGQLDPLRAHIAEGLANAQSPHEDLHPVTPVHYAVDGGSVAAARLLLASGAGVRTSGGRLLTSAAKQGSIELVRLLLDHGAEAACAESLGPLRTDQTIAGLLVLRGFDLNVPIRDQETPLTMACRADKGRAPRRRRGPAGAWRRPKREERAGADASRGRDERALRPDRCAASCRWSALTLRLENSYPPGLLMIMSTGRAKSGGAAEVVLQRRSNGIFSPASMAMGSLFSAGGSGQVARSV